MTKQRSSIFPDLGSLDISGFKPKSDPDKGAPTKAEVRAVTESTNFKSREPSTPEAIVNPKPTQRRILRTGRNVQLNVKTSQEAINDFYAITDAHAGWVLGYTFERAVAALKRELETSAQDVRPIADARSETTGQRTTSGPRV